METIKYKIGEMIIDYLQDEGINADETSNYDAEGYIELCRNDGDTDENIAYSLLGIYMGRKIRELISKDIISKTGFK